MRRRVVSSFVWALGSTERVEWGDWQDRWEALGHLQGHLDVQEVYGSLGKKIERWLQVFVKWIGVLIGMVISLAVRFEESVIAS